jgi:hypothetical protein
MSFLVGSGQFSSDFLVYLSKVFFALFAAPPSNYQLLNGDNLSNDQIQSFFVYLDLRNYCLTRLFNT